MPKKSGPFEMAADEVMKVRRIVNAPRMRVLDKT
jgi:hypothetical protein